MRILYLRSDRNAQVYGEQEKTQSGGAGGAAVDQCATCGVYSKALKKYTACKKASYCNTGGIWIPNMLLFYSSHSFFSSPRKHSLSEETLEVTQSPLQKTTAS